MIHNQGSVDRILNKSIPEPNSGCWIWMGYMSKHGYGRIRFEGRLWVVSRLMWTLAKGDVPDGLFVCHKCDNRTCVNIDHLFLGTKKDNAVDMARKGRHGIAKIKNSDVPTIRRLSASGLSNEQISRMYGVTRRAIFALISGQTWSHVTE